MEDHIGRYWHGVNDRWTAQKGAPFLNLNEIFCFTYGDGVADVNISDVVEHHKKQNVLATMLAVQPLGRLVPLILIRIPV